MAIMHMFHSEILASLNFNKNNIFSPGLENNHTLKCCSGIFQHNHMSRLLEKYQNNIWMYSYSQKRWKTMEQLCPLLSTRIWTFSPGLENEHILKCWSGIFSTILTYMIKLENCRTTFQCMVMLQSRGQNFILVEINWSQDLRVEY